MYFVNACNVYNTFYVMSVMYMLCAAYDVCSDCSAFVCVLHAVRAMYVIQLTHVLYVLGATHVTYVMHIAYCNEMWCNGV